MSSHSTQSAPVHAAGSRSLGLLAVVVSLVVLQPGCRVFRANSDSTVMQAFRPVAMEPSRDASQLLLPPPPLESPWASSPVIEPPWQPTPESVIAPNPNAISTTGVASWRRSWWQRGATGDDANEGTVASWPEAVEDLLTRAAEQDAANDAACVDNFYQAALLTAPAAAQSWSAGKTDDAGREIRELHGRALTELLVSAQRHGRLDLHRGLLIHEQGESARMPVRFIGLPWQPRDFGQLLPAEGLESSELARHYAIEGLGVPMVVQRPGVSNLENAQDEIEPNSYFARHHTFPVSVVMQPADEESGIGTLEFYNPYTQATVPLRNGDAPLARDLSAPLALMAKSTTRQYWRGFTAPTDVSVRPRVLFAEPYQRGKIPVLFIHGLYSDPITWIDMLNELKSEPDICARYQLWFYRYPTGAGLLGSVARLREHLHQIREQFDPERSDESFDQMVLVGHSMGGLAAKLMVTNSEDIIWKQIARGPFERLKAPADLKMQLAHNVFFEAQPYITRVVFIATPHRGSAMARRLAGKLGAQLVRVGGDMNWSFRTMLQDNEDLFREDFTSSLPTSVDLLEPSSPVLRAMARMSIEPQVRTHSIIGTDNHLLQEPGDGVVSIQSARHKGVISEEYVAANHEKVHRHPDATDEVLRILRLHIGELH
jgi:pimeloyl-ACP methyl ester carboxylesterase